MGIARIAPAVFFLVAFLPLAVRSVEEGREMARLTECEQVAGSMIRIADVEATLSIAGEFISLSKSKPCGIPVEMAVLRKDVSGFVFPPTKAYRIILPSASKRLLRHEYHHVWRSSRGLANWSEEAEAEAIAAERESVPKSK